MSASLSPIPQSHGQERFGLIVHIGCIVYNTCKWYGISLNPVKARRSCCCCHHRRCCAGRHRRRFFATIYYCGRWAKIHLALPIWIEIILQMCMHIPAACMRLQHFSVSHFRQKNYTCVRACVLPVKNCWWLFCRVSRVSWWMHKQEQNHVHKHERKSTHTISLTMKTLCTFFSAVVYLVPFCEK